MHSRSDFGGVRGLRTRRGIMPGGAWHIAVTPFPGTYRGLHGRGSKSKISQTSYVRSHSSLPQLFAVTHEFAERGEMPTGNACLTFKLVCLALAKVNYYIM